jgi:hypothetical protein
MRNGAASPGVKFMGFHSYRREQEGGANVSPVDVHFGLRRERPEQKKERKLSTLDE